MKYKCHIDTINVNFIDELDHEKIISSKNKLEYIDMFPKIKLVFSYFNIPENKLHFRNNSLSSKVGFNSDNGIYVEIKTLPPKSKLIPVNANIKIVSLQFKGVYFLKNSFQDFLKYYNSIGFKQTISKIEIAIDVNLELVEYVAKCYLSKPKKLPVFKGGEIYLTLNDEVFKNISIISTTKIFKCYNKIQQLKDHKKTDIYFNKNEEFKEDLAISRIEFGYFNSKRIYDLFDLENILKSNPTEKQVIELIANQFFKDFKIKNNRLKKILKSTILRET